MTYRICASTTEKFKLEIFHDEDGWSSNPRDNDNAGTMMTWESRYGSPDPLEWDTWEGFRTEWLPSKKGTCPSCGNNGTVKWKRDYYLSDPMWGERYAATATASPIERDGEYRTCSWCGHNWIPGPGIGKGGVCLLLHRGGYNGDISARGRIEDWEESDGDPDGVIFVTAETVAKEWGAFTKNPRMYDGRPILEFVADYLQGEVSEYSTWAVGNVYGYVLSERKHLHVTETDRESEAIVRDDDEDRWEELDSCWGFITENPDKDVPEWAEIESQVGKEEYAALVDNMKFV